MPHGTPIEIKPAKGRPMLTWVGKRPLRHVTAFPAQLVEVFDPQSAIPNPQSTGLLFHGDNKEVLAHLLANGYRGQVKLVYIDPPFDSGADYVRKVSLRGATAAAKLDGESYTLGEQVQYTDIWANDNYLQFMYERLTLLRELLAEDGSLYLHCDWHKSHHLRCLMDEIFGVENLRNEIIWQRTSARSDSTTYNHIHDTLLFYTKGDEFTWNPQYEEHSDEYITDKYVYSDEDGRKYQLVDMTSPHPRPNMMYEWMGHSSPEKGWRYSKETMRRLHEQGRIWYPADKSKRIRLKKYLDEAPGRPLQSVWTTVYPVNSQATEREGYPTQKPEALIERLILTSSNPGDLVLDCFIGSGTTAAVAQKLGRRWIACDINKGAIQTTAKRLMAVIRDQLDAAEQASGQLDLLADESAIRNPQPAIVTSFAVYRVNDYDLQIQHNEAVALACEHIGVTRTRGDAFFDGMLGKRLVKIIPFGHPLTPLDLEEVKRELAARPDEDRDVVVVCLGKELGADAWLAEWNRLRGRGDVPNRIEVIELRTDLRYGGFITHQPADARVQVARTDGGKIRVIIQDFISPAIIERLKQQATLLNPQIEDWRAMVDSVMIDPAYDGQTFNVTLADVPEKKTDLVAGIYELDAPAGATTVAVKVTDMLGEEVLKTYTAQAGVEPEKNRPLQKAEVAVI